MLAFLGFFSGALAGFLGIGFFRLAWLMAREGEPLDSRRAAYRWAAGMFLLAALLWSLILLL